MSSREIPRKDNLIDVIKGLKTPPTTTDDGWIKVGDSSDEISPEWQNPWDHQDPDAPVSFFLDPNGVVRFRGKAAGGADGTVMFTLPEGYRPEFDEDFLGPSELGGDGICRLTVQASGDVLLNVLDSTVIDLSAVHSGDTADGDVEGTFPGSITLKPGANGFWKTVSGAITRATNVAWSELSGIPSTFTPSPGSDGYWKTVSGVLTKVSSIIPDPHKDTHVSGGSDEFISTDLLEAIIKRIRESSGPTDLTIGAIADGQFLKRSGSTIVSASGTGGSTWSVLTNGDPVSPELVFDSFGDVIMTEV